MIVGIIPGPNNRTRTSVYEEDVWILGMLSKMPWWERNINEDES